MPNSACLPDFDLPCCARLLCPLLPQFCFNQCNGRGECKGGYCKCDPGGWVNDEWRAGAGAAMQLSRHWMSWGGICSRIESQAGMAL